LSFYIHTFRKMENLDLSAIPTTRTVYKLNDIQGFNDLMDASLHVLIQEEQPKTLKVNKVTYKTNMNQEYKIIRYDKNVLTRDMILHHGLLRSVIVNSANKVVSFSPPKSVPLDVFRAYFENQELIQNIQAEEFVEGTMMNVFWDETIGINGTWEIATRNSVGGEISFYTTKNSTRFRTMFKEALEYCHLDLNDLSKHFCYSFVMQHPENRIVCTFTKPALYLVEVFEIVNTEDGTVNVFPLNLDFFKKEKSVFKNTTVRFPEIYGEWNTIQDVKDKYASMNTDFEVMGVVLREKITNMRTKIRNPVYEHVKNLRGTDAKLQYKYLVLRKQDKIKEYLETFPTHKKIFSTFRQQLHDFTNQLMKNYVDCYIRKEKTDIPQEYKSHLYMIHRHYVDVLKPAGEYVNKTVVIKYINDLDSGSLLYSLNRPLLKRYKKMEMEKMECDL
jgi:hypothetical protein